MGFQSKGEWSITDTPWPMMMKYGIANFPTEECDWIWENFEYAPFHSPSYDFDYEHIQKQCKPSNWDPSSLPRIAEDGRVCGGLAYWATGIHTCLGRPATQVGQPGHGCHIYYDRDVQGKWVHVISGSVYANWQYVTSQHVGNEMMTDEVSGVVKTREQGVEVSVHVTKALNIGMDSYIDTRLALILYRAVYMSEGSSQAYNLMNVLLSALENNPHNIEAWDLIIANIGTGVSQEDDIITKAYSLLRPWMSDYPQTFEAMLHAVSGRYTCDSTPVGLAFANFLEGEIEALVNAAGRGSCDAYMRSTLRFSFMGCLGNLYDTTAKMYEWMNEDFFRLMRLECDPYSIMHNQIQAIPKNPEEANDPQGKVS